MYGQGFFFDFRDHIVNLYGPTLVHEEGKGGMLLQPVKSDILDFDEHVERKDASLRPRMNRSSSARGSFRKISASFRRRGNSEAANNLPLYTLPVPQDGSERSRKTSKDELEVVRNVLRSSFRSTQRKVLQTSA